MPDTTTVQATLVALKAQCEAACGDAAATVHALDDDARRAAMVAHHVQTHGKDSLAKAIAAGPLKFLDQDHIAEVARVASAGGDPVKAAGAKVKDVELLQAAVDTHAPHAKELAQAYADFAAATS